MSSANEKVTVLSTSAATDGGQPLHRKPNQIISEKRLKSKVDFETERQFQQAKAWDSLETLTELFDTLFPPKAQIVDQLLCAGLYILAGAPKIGKSFLSAQLAYHVSKGIALWGYPVHQSKAIYFALEDTKEDHQKRLARMFGTDDADDYLVETEAGTLQEGFDLQLYHAIRSYPDAKLIIIDPLQKVRGIDGKEYSYANDYKIITRLKQFSDRYNICILVVHHTRKQIADDCFDTISGTSGLLGAADGALVLRKEKRTGNNAVLDIVGRNQQDQRLDLSFDRQSCVWNLMKMETELWNEPPDPLLEKIAKLLTPESPQWKDSATSLIEALGGMDIQPNILTRQLNVSANRLWNEYGITIDIGRGNTGRWVHLMLIRGNNVDNDGYDDNNGG